jgi:hypothetical protein
MIAAALALIVVGVVLGFFFPVMFVAALAGAFLLVLSFAAGVRRTKAETESADPGVDTLR